MSHYANNQVEIGSSDWEKMEIDSLDLTDRQEALVRIVAHNQVVLYGYDFPDTDYKSTFAWFNRYLSVPIINQHLTITHKFPSIDRFRGYQFDWCNMQDHPLAPAYAAAQDKMSKVYSTTSAKEPTVSKFNLLKKSLSGQIKTSFDYPPIPVRHLDWSAWIDGYEEDGPHGRGSTQTEAVIDLMEQLEDQYDNDNLTTI